MSRTKSVRRTKSNQVAWVLRLTFYILIAAAAAVVVSRCGDEREAAPSVSGQPATRSAGASTQGTAPSKSVVTESLPPATQAATAQPSTPKTADLRDAGPLPESEPPPQVYTVKRGDTLSSIAHRFNLDMQEIIEINQIDNPNILSVGQTLKIPTTELDSGPATILLPDSEFVYGPAYVAFEIAAFSAEQGGYFSEYYERVGGEVLSGSEIVELVAHHHSVGPRLLLAILELKSGWVTDPNPTGDALSFPMGYKGGGWELLSQQLAWAADELNQGYYDWRGRGIAPLTWRDGTATAFSPKLNAATAGLHHFLAQNVSRNRWETWVGDGPESFAATYRRLFGEPDRYAIEPLIPPDLTMPELSLPWSRGELWYYTGGPHGGWEHGGAWAALDFVPDEGAIGCRVASSWATAAASGLVIYSQDGEVMIDLDGDGHEQTGWVLFYLHVAAKGRVAAGTWVNQGDPIGHPSCEGGLSEATHLHIARRFNGEWIAAEGPLPFVLSGWQAQSSGSLYNGTMSRGGEVRTACECRRKDYNGLLADR